MRPSNGQGLGPPPPPGGPPPQPNGQVLGVPGPCTTWGGRAPNPSRLEAAEPSTFQEGVGRGGGGGVVVLPTTRGEGGGRKARRGGGGGSNRTPSKTHTDAELSNVVHAVLRLKPDR